MYICCYIHNLYIHYITYLYYIHLYKYICLYAHTFILVYNNIMQYFNNQFGPVFRVSSIGLGTLRSVNSKSSKGYYMYLYMYSLTYTHVLYIHYIIYNVSSHYIHVLHTYYYIQYIYYIQCTIQAISLYPYNGFRLSLPPSLGQVQVNVLL